MTFDTALVGLHGVGEKVMARLESLELKTVGDLVYNWPRRYEDFTNPRLIADITSGEHQIIEGRIISVENVLSPRQHMKLTHAVVSDQSGQFKLVWFNQPFLIRLLKPEARYLFAGKVERDYHGQLAMVSPTIEREGKIVPIYSETVGLSSKVIRKLVYQLRPFMQSQLDWLPRDVINKNRLMDQAAAIVSMHFPNSIDEVKAAKHRLAFDELFLLLLRIQQTKADLAEVSAPSCPSNIEAIKNFTANLPFPLTDSQRRAGWQIIQDVAKSRPMNRLLEGDVGSGKTVVGALAAIAVTGAGYQVVWMAPTEILAQQHYQTCSQFLPQLRIALLSGSTSAKVGPNINQYDFVIGTQALIQEKVHFDRLGLIIVDEQHRFGVRQRNHLVQNTRLVPHFLAMTATPIPRTLALTIYGDLDFSLLQSIATGRKPVVSRFTGSKQRHETYEFMRQQIRSGRQAFVVCPLVSSSEESKGQLDLGLEEKRAAIAEYEKLRKHIFPDLRIGLIHGKLKSSEKAAIMSAFKGGEIDILVATAVIEVGIDIPNASVIIIEGADRFGLAQLHQFRGRVGRGEHQSYCFVFSDNQNSVVTERLRAFTTMTSGFELAELDLKLRGPGQLTGLTQSGLSDLKLASLSDIDLIQAARRSASTVIADGLSLALRAALNRGPDASLS